MKPTSVFLIDRSRPLIEATANLFQDHEEIELVGWSTSTREAAAQIVCLLPDVVVVDLAQQDREGLALITRLNNMCTPPAVVVISFYDHPSYQRIACEAGAAAFLSKLDLFTQLVPLIERLRPGLLTMACAGGAFGCAACA